MKSYYLHSNRVHQYHISPIPKSKYFYKIMRYLMLILSLIALLSACIKPPTTVNVASPDAKHFTLRGKVIAVNRAKKTATVEHNAVAGYMDAMTMEFPVRADEVWDDMKVGSDIRADLVIDKGENWLENISLTAPLDANNAVATNDNFVRIGKEVPEFTLTNQDGKRISTKDFKGKAWALTFIYAQCPLPDYCIKMSKNFSDAAIQISANAELKDKFRLLSVSFDPSRDTPEKLRQYGQGYLGKDAKPDFTVWQLAVGEDKQIKSIADFFGLRYETDPQDKTQFLHSLRTAVIAPDGKVTKIFPDNEWTADDLTRELKATLK